MSSAGMFRPVPRTGVIYVMTEAAMRGFRYGHPQWCNLGQGAPETGELPGCAPRLHTIELNPESSEYAPVAGLWELREAVAELYNHRYRRGLPSRYSAENVAIASGGRVALTRLATALGRVNLGHLLPDYTAYEELLDVFRAFVPIPIVLPERNGFRLSPEALREAIVGSGLGAILLSNPCNPTGRVIAGEDLRGWVTTAGKLGCALIVDEFYAHYIYGPTGPTGQVGERPRSIQAAFARKRSLMLERLAAMGIGVAGADDGGPEGAFYCFADLRQLPEPLSDGMSFFRKALERQLITVPGVFFDVDPGKRRDHIASRLPGFVRLSFGPDRAQVETGLDRLADLVAEAS
jgi:aspartate/methionine/tyrosine aminotransferase